MGKFRLAVATAIVALVGASVFAALPANAYNCTTTCAGNTCYTRCN